MGHTRTTTSIWISVATFAMMANVLPTACGQQPNPRAASPAPQPTPSAAPTINPRAPITPDLAPVARVSAGGHDRGGRIYLFLSAAGWPKTWKSYDDPTGGFVPPDKPNGGADLRYWFTSQAETAKTMRCDGLIFTTPHVPPPKEIPTSVDGQLVMAKNPEAWRMQFEGRLNALRNNPAMGDADAIQDGLRRAREILPAPAEFILYAGCPNVADLALARDEDWCDAYVRGSIGPYVTAKDSRGAYVVSRLIIDSAGSDLGLEPVSRAVERSVRRQYPWLLLGAEPLPIKSVGDNYISGLTTRASWGNVTLNGVIKEKYKSPAQMATLGAASIVFYSQGPRFDMADAEKQIDLHRVSIAVLAWTVGMEPKGPQKPEDRQRWLEFVERIHAKRTKLDQPPEASQPAPRK